MFNIYGYRKSKVFIYLHFIIYLNYLKSTSKDRVLIFYIDLQSVFCCINYFLRKYILTKTKNSVTAVTKIFSNKISHNMFKENTRNYIFYYVVTYFKNALAPNLKTIKGISRCLWFLLYIVLFTTLYHRNSFSSMRNVN